MDTQEQEKITERKFSIVRRAKSFAHAGRGVWILIKTTHNAWVEVFLLCFALFLGFFFHITHYEWLMLILAGGMTFAAEAFNTAIEIDIDLTSPDIHPMARDVKDVAAGAVLITAVAALLIGLFIFAPYIIAAL
jgi:diacylglycerol kinase (ATP)